MDCVNCLLHSLDYYIHHTFGLWAGQSFTSYTFMIVNHAPPMSLFSILCLFYTLLACTLPLIKTPHLLHAPSTCDTHAPPCLCLLFLGLLLYLFCAPPLTTHVLPFFYFSLLSFLNNCILLFIYLFYYY